MAKAKALTRDHKPDEPDEAARILSNGGRIASFIGKALVIDGVNL